MFRELDGFEELGGAAVEGFDAVGAGEDEPVVGAEAGEGGVQGSEGGGGSDFDGRDEDGGRAEGFEACGEIGGLLAGPGDENALVGQGWHFVGIVCLVPGGTSGVGIVTQGAARLGSAEVRGH
ncbi:MAG: hypothetical protein JWQ49_5353 [Edaphobacter sp.]|nr:hypothetical protein [Edaphobacter sp.]